MHQARRAFPIFSSNFRRSGVEPVVTTPETRTSLILRLGDPADDQAWIEFLEIYEPMLLRLAMRWGLQDADAREVVQETLLAVAGAISNFSPADHPGAFRSWLASITRHKLADHLARHCKQANGSGDSSVQRWLNEQASPASGDSLWDWNQKQQVFAWAALRVKKQVSEPTWLAFQRTAVDGESVSDVAVDLGMREGMVYVARSRVMARLRKAARQWTDETTESSDEM